MIVGIQDEILRLHAMGRLNDLLADKTTRGNIIWATDAYRARGDAYRRGEEMLPSLMTGAQSDVIKTRARKAMEEQSARTRKHAEVFTPPGICKRMVGEADAAYFDGDDPFLDAARVVFPKRRKWQHYVDARRLEITCGEAPYLVQRYDVSTGEVIPLEERHGILDRKLRIVNENTGGEDEWMKWALRAFQATYGYEFQGDNLLIARVNLLMTFEEYLYARWKRKPHEREYRGFIKTIVWNLWQMDGLTGTIPYAESTGYTVQGGLFDLPDTACRNLQPYCRIYDWRRVNSLEYRRANTGGRNMKFDVVIGNPPYQDERQGTSTTALPIYHTFMEAAYKVGKIVELITPARFLFDAGRTPKEWNERMLQDPHLKVLFYEQDASKMFSNTDIKGGVVITYRDEDQDFGAVETFVVYSEVNDILRKVKPYLKKYGTLASRMFVCTKFNTKNLFREYPQYEGHEHRMSSNVLEFECFHDHREEHDIMIYGLIRGRRSERFIHRKFVDLTEENISKYKIITPKAEGNGNFGEILTNPVLLNPNSGFTHTFLGVAGFEERDTAINALQYIKTKFVRALLSVLKITQNVNAEKWKYVPLQDFTSSSDIDWSASVAEIDKQLYAKYGLTEEETLFIESHVKEMA
ncbi:Eco57I restriction-modification methylase domain-containing protein [Selenomonas artemidis]|uniref:Eco57I restriction-modification methylase domain-containing protein n=1 Tax=Selenomonas artemidis TaxID=671224 RepID=UPI00288A6B9C|nr:Eco57I restriction-modification methylase domain-containing protein [Selenomonas artemidis]